MWILPAALEGLQVELTAGPHLLPWHYTEDEVDRLAWLLRAVLAGIDGELRLDDATLRVLSDRRVTAPTSLVVAVLRETSPALEEASERVRALGARCALLQLREPQEMGYGWLEREVKAPLYRTISAWVKRPEHPLAALNVRALPVMDVAALTTDPIELIAILERALSHRLQHAEVCCSDDDFHRSLLLSAGKRLGARLKRLDDGALGEQKALRAAVDVLLSAGNEVEDRALFREGAQALDRVGLARFVAGELSLGPLARQATQSLALGALESELPAYAWSDSAREKVGAVLRARGAVAPDSLVAGRGQAAPAMVDVPPPLDLLEDPIAKAFSPADEAQEVLGTLRDIASVPVYCAELPAALNDRLVRSLRWLSDAQESSAVLQQRAGSVLHELLLLWSARGASARSQQDLALKRLEASVGAVPFKDPEPWIEQAVAIAGLRSAVLMVRHPQAREDLGRAEDLVRGYLDVAERLSREDEALEVAAYLCLAEIALRRDDHDRAHDCADKALHLARRSDDSGGSAASLICLARVSNGQKRFVEAERCAREALDLLEPAGDSARIGACLRVIANILDRRGGVMRLFDEVGSAEARAFGERALAMAEALGDVDGRIESLMVLANVTITSREYDRSSALALQAASLADSTAALDLRAEAYLWVAVSFWRRDDHDQAVQWTRQALPILEQIGSPSELEGVRELLAAVTKN